MKKNGKYIVVSSAILLLLIIISALMILYDKGYFDLSFIPRTNPDDTSSAQTTDPADSTEPVPDGTDTSPSDTSEDTSGPQDEKSVFDIIHETVPDRAGRILSPTEDIYDPGTMQLYRLDNVSITPQAGEPKTTIRKIYDVRYNGKLRVFTEMSTLMYLRDADVYMGTFFTVLQNGYRFYDGNGELIYEYTGDEPLTFAYERDGEGRPLFLIGGQYYYLDVQGHGMQISDYDRRDTRGLYYNYPSTFGKSEGQFTAFRSGDKFGVKNTEGKTVRNAIYEEGYNYSEGLGLVSYDGDICYLNEAGKVAIENYYMVGERDEHGIGSIYFDGGYVMMRKIKTDIRGKTVEDQDVLIDTKGREFELPGGYTAVSYSNERVLVEKDGKYGFYAVKGAWIANADYTYATPYYEGLAVVGTDGARAVIDMDGNTVIPMSYSYISVCSGGIIVCWSEQTGYEVYVKSLK